METPKPQIIFEELTSQEKLDFVLTAIIEARQKNPSSHVLEVLFEYRSIYPKSDRQQIEKILYDLEENKKIIRFLEYNHQSTHQAVFGLTSHPESVLKSEVLKITLRVLNPAFDNWYSVYLFEKNQKLEDLDLLHLENIYNTILDVDERLQINPSTTVKIKLNQDCRFPSLDKKCGGLLHSADYRRDALTFLARKNIITDVEIHHSEYDDNTVDVALNLEKFQQFKGEIAKVYQSKTTGKSSSNEILYTLTYNEMTGEISINNKVFKKTNLDSIVDNVFAYLNKNPNRRITISELKKATGKAIKDLPKVIENAGFTGNRLRAFFRVSKDAIYFRSQITKADLEKLSIVSLD